MEFLGIDKKTISNFQLLLLQTEVRIPNCCNVIDCLRSLQSVLNCTAILYPLQTRIADWREGALNGNYLRRRLQEAAEHIKHYELNAAPKGWSCHWDRYALLTFHILITPPSLKHVTIDRTASTT